MCLCIGVCVCVCVCVPVHLYLSLFPFLCTQDYFDEGEYVIREGEEGNTFFIIAQGGVRLNYLLP